MNIFITSEDQKQIARDHCDVHLNKMILETSQLLSNAHRIIDGHSGHILRKKKDKETKVVTEHLSPYAHVLYHLGENNRNPALYLLTHVKHPSSVWVRTSVMNYRWTYHLLQEFHAEYEFRFGKKHKSKSILSDLKNTPRGMKNIKMTPFVGVYNDEFIFNGPVLEGYKGYMNYKYNKWSEENAAGNTRKKYVQWTRRDVPDFVREDTLENIKIYCTKVL